jgi:hypothetical protein
MTDKTNLIREIHEYVTAHGGENKATHLLVQAASAIQTQAAELEAVGAGGVSGPLMGIAAPPTAQAEGWVSVEERLPAKNTEVLICFAESPLPSTGQYTGHAADPAGWCYPKESYLWPGESEKLPDGGAPTVTHWMPIPPLPTSAEGVEHG